MTVGVDEVLRIGNTCNLRTLYTSLSRDLVFPEVTDPTDEGSRAVSQDDIQLKEQRMEARPGIIGSTKIMEL